MDDYEIIEALSEELQNAEEEHPLYPTDVIHQAAILGEKSGEVIKAALQYVYESKSKEEIRKEIIQTGAMCIRMLRSLDNTNRNNRDQAKDSIPKWKPSPGERVIPFDDMQYPTIFNYDSWWYFVKFSYDGLPICKPGSGQASCVWNHVAEYFPELEGKTFDEIKKIARWV